MFTSRSDAADATYVTGTVCGGEYSSPLSKDGACEQSLRIFSGLSELKGEPYLSNFSQASNS